MRPRTTKPQTLRLLLTSTLALGLFIACSSKPTVFDTNVEVIQVQRFGQDPKAPGLLDLELKFADCPGDARRVVRADKGFSQCIGAVKAGDKLPAQVTHAWNADRGSYRSDFVKIGACPIKVDPKEDANYEMVQVCTDLQATGVTVGVHCDRSRPKELTQKCPWLRRN